MRIEPPRDIIGRPLRHTEFQATYGLHIVAVKSGADGETARFADPTPGTVFRHGDILLAAGTLTAVERFAKSS